MAEEAAAHHLLNVLEERDLNVDLDKVLAAFEDADTKKEAAAWVNEYLNESTLLTREELELYQALKKKGVLQQYEDSDDPIRPILDHELSSAIDSLESSTAAIEEQCRVLEAQRDALMALKALDKPNLAVEHQRNERRRKEHLEKGRLDITVEDVSTFINDQVTDTQRDIDNAKSTLKSYIKERLASDDKILTALPNIVSKVLTEPESSEDEKSVEQWCNAIVSFRTAEIKARVDTVFLNSLNNSSEADLPNAPEHELQELKQAPQAELETLHSEISSVAEMVVEHELRKPMTDSKERKERDRANARSAWLKYILSTLSFMSDRLSTITSHTTNITEFQQALTHIYTAASARLQPANAEPVPPPLRRQTSSLTKPAFPTLLKLKPTQTLKLPVALQDALRHAGVSFTQDSIPLLRESLLKTQMERQEKLAEHYASALDSSHTQLAEKLGKADQDSRVVLDALYAHTPFATVQLGDEEVGKRIREVEREIGERESELLDVETHELSLADPRVRAFVGRWGK